jgi:hypothetical protein
MSKHADTVYERQAAEAFNKQSALFDELYSGKYHYSIQKKKGKRSR